MGNLSVAKRIPRGLRASRGGFPDFAAGKYLGWRLGGRFSGIPPSEIRRSVPPRVRFFPENHLGTWGIPLNQIRGSTDSESPRTPRIRGKAKPMTNVDASGAAASIRSEHP